MTISSQLPVLSLAAQAPDPDAADVIPASDGGPVPGDETAISMFTAHRLDDGMRHLAHATERMQAARATTDPDLRAYHSGHIARHLEAALDAAHDLTANIREHYPPEAAELEQVKQAVGLASGYDLNPRSGMISLDLPPGTITPIPGGVSDHHVTVVYLGPDVDDEAFAQAQDRARKAAAAMPGPLTGTVGGIGTFPPSGSSDGKVPAWAGVVLPGADRLRSALEDLSASEHKDWKPHVTVAYVAPGEALPSPVPATPVTFTHLSVHRGDDEVERFPLGGSAAGLAGGSWEAIGLAKSLTPEVKAATTAHLLETTLHEETHGVRHAVAMTDPEPGDVWEFNADHCEKHLGGAVEHAGKLRAQFADNYPAEAKWLAGLDEITAGAEEDGKQHARYAKGSIGAQLANPVTGGGQQLGMAGRPKAGTISGQFDLSAASRAKAHATASATARATELRDERGRWAEGDAVHEHLGKPALSRSQADTLSRYQGSLYHQMDAYLNTGDIHAADDEMGSHVISEPDMGKQVRNLDSIFKTIPPTTKPLVVYRGMTLPDATPGTVWTDKTPVSTSSDRATGEQYKGYAADADPGHAVLARITVPPGSKALSMKNQLPGDYSQAQQEAEVLLPRNSQFRITGVSGGAVDAQLLPAAENVGPSR